ncbi:mediator of RNA polymerase II transcription subunit 23-like isoform X1 [Cynara cardunculus var. scolymus]|uniref:Mediator complex, subunit Med23 n=1 Tax=Cynara cardunculus var. scolymus TaxID=59895 RepID=A0A118JXQ1_CYNCS|nr:mediator of RNA polymerase II transcription subunit 23-like isoform X1 [Cynara cardunculus var. scolymus]KVH97672.1 Mediator complex, subunit Med23 [Cynara cardunculus var. scolymus]
MLRTPTTSSCGGSGGIPLTITTSAQSPNPSDMGDQSHHRSSASRAFQFHPARPAIVDLFNLYLGRNGRHKSDDLIREPPNKTQKRVTALNRDIPPCNGQFLSDFQQLQNQFPDHDQLRTVVESVLVSLVIQCSGHAPRAEFILFALNGLYSVGYICWDSFLPSLLSSVTSAEMSVGISSAASPQPAVSSTSLSNAGMLPSSAVALNFSNFQSPNPESPLISVHGIGSPSQSANEPSCTALSPVKSSDINSTGQQAAARGNMSRRDSAISTLRKLSCEIIFSALEANLKPTTHADIFYHMLNWLVNWDQWQQGSDEVDGVKSLKREKALFEWLHKCLDVVWMLIEDNKCRIPFYELLRSGLQFIENLPDDEALFTLILEVHRRRDMMAMHMQMLDQHLHCPTFGNQRLLCQAAINMLGESTANLRYSPITYPSVLGEPLHGEDIAFSIERGSLDWDRAMRCIRHALRNTPSPDWWRRVLLVAPCHRVHSQGPTPGAVFSSDMICEATIDRVIELLMLTNTDANCWQEWLIYSDVFFFLMKSGCIDFVDFVDRLVLRISEEDHQILRTNHVTWLLAQIIRAELVMSALNTDSRKMETTRKVLSFHKEAISSVSSNPQSILLDFITSCQTLRIWSLNSSTREYLNSEQLHKGKQIDEWWRQVSKGDHMMDYMNLDDRSVGMFWVVSYTMAQPACEMVMTWLTSAGHAELPGPNLQANEKISVMREVNPVPVSLLSGFSINLCLKLAFQMEDAMFSGQYVPNIAMVETYTRLLLIQPHSLFRSHLSHLHQRNSETFNKPAATLLMLEILNYRLFPLYRYQGKSKTLMYDVTKILSTLKGKRGDHRVFRLAENLCMNLIMSLREFFFVRREGKGPTEFTETLNRVTVVTLAIIIKTRGIADAEHLLYLQTMLEQILATSHHTWSDKTLCYFPAVLRDALIGRTDKRDLAIQAWQQAEATVIHQCTQLLSPPDDPTYVMTYISHSFPQHRQYLCAGAWVLMRGHPENINSANLGRVLREFSPEEVTANVYTMVDVLLHNIQLDLQHGHSLQDLILNACANLAHFIWNHELLPPDILLLALIDRDDDPHALRIVVNLLERQELQQRIKFYVANHDNPEHWLQNGIFKRIELQKSLGHHLSWKERYPTYFDDIAARLLPVIPLIIYRLIENDATDVADRVLQLFSSFLRYYPLNFTFVRDILAYFYGHLPGKLIFQILNVLDIKKMPFSESFLQRVNSSNAICPPLEYFASLLSGLVANVIPPLCNLKGEGSNQSGSTNAFECQKPFYQIQDPGTYTQLILETAVIEILSLPVTPAQIVSAFVQIIVHIQPTLIQSNHSFHESSNSSESCSALATSPSGGITDFLDGRRSNPSTTELDLPDFVSQSGYTYQKLSCVLIQACGLLLAQLPAEFHIQLYAEASRVIKESWWHADGGRSTIELDSAVGYALLDPTWAAQDNTSTALGNMVALLHAFFSNLPQEWLDKTHLLINNLRPVSSIAVLRIAFRIIGPLLPRLANAHSLFTKTLELLLSMMVDVFGRNSQPSPPVEASDITDLIDFLHHIVHYEGQGGPVQPNSKPKPDVLGLCGRAIENLRKDVQHLLSHLKTDGNCSIYAAAATNPKLSQNLS